VRAASEETSVQLSGPGASRRVVVGVDGSPESVEAVRYGAEEAAARGVELLVVHAYAASPPRDGAETAAQRTSARALVEETLSHVIVAPTTVVRTLVEAAPAAALLTSLTGEATLLVLGKHHVDPAEGRLAGPIAFAVAAEARCPVVVVPGGWRHDVARSAHLGPRPIVVGMSEKTSATSVLRLAYDEAELRQASVLILHASTAAEPATGLRAASARTAAEFVAGQAQDHPDVAVDYRYVPGEPVLALVELSSRARLMVLGRPRHQPGRLPWRRSVARAMLHQSRCPLMVVPPGTRPTSADDRAGRGSPVLVP
jgi:nucleotide-binding universal stress UspA family protein